jgi:uncharacterized membrane-anchored protein YhcB (DUF1043 family)
VAVTKDSLVVDISVNGKAAAADIEQFNSKLRDSAKQADQNTEALKQWSDVFAKLSVALKSSNAETMAYMKSAIDAQTKAQEATKKTAQIVQETANRQSGIVQSAKDAMAEVYQTFDKTSKVISDNQLLIAGALLGGIVVMKDNVLELIKKFASGLDGVVGTVGKVAGAFNAIGNVVKKTLPGSFFVITDIIGILTPSLIMLGSKLEESNSAFVRTTGTILKFSGILLGGFSAAVGFAINKMGDLAVAFGTTMLEEMRKSSDEFEKYQFSMKQFSSTINGFAMEFGNKAVGSLGKWSDVLQQVNMTTTFSRDSIAGAIKLITRETAHLGLGFEDAIKILKTSADLAAVSGTDLTETTQKTISAISGESSSLTQLGFDLRNSVLAKSAYVKSTGLAVEQLDEEQATMARLKTLYEQTAPIIGAAAAQTDTITGAQILYKKTVDDVNITLGQHAVLTRYFTAQTIKAYTAFADMPKPILHVIGVLKDFFAILFIGIGSLIKFSLGITAIVVAFKLLRGAALAYMGVQISLGAMMGSLLSVLAPLAAAILFADFALKKMTASSGGMSYILKNMSASFGSTAQASEELGSSMNAQADKVSFLSLAMTKLLDIVAAISSTVVNGLGEAILMGSSLIVQFQQAFSSSEEDFLAYQLMLEDIENQINSLSDEIKQSWEDVFPSQTLKAKAIVSSVDQVNAAVKKFRDTATKAAKEINKDFSEVSELQKALANDFERAAMKVADTKKQLGAVFDVKMSPKETAEKLASAEKEVIIARVEAEKLRFDTIKKLEEDRQSAKIKELKDQGNIIAAIKEETKQRLEQIYKTEAGLKKIGGVRLEEQMIINQSIKSLKNSESAEIQAAKLESLKKVRDLEDAVNKIKLEGAKSDQNVINSIVARTSQRKEELDQIHKIAALEGDQKKRADALLKIGYESLELYKNQEIEKKRFDILRATVKETRDLANVYAEMSFLGMDALSFQNQESLNAIELKRTEAELQGLLTDAVIEQYEVQKRLTGDIYAKNISNLVRSNSLFGDFFQDFKEYYSMMSDLTGMSLSKVFEGLEGILKNAISLATKFKEKVTGNVSESSPNFVGPKKEVKPSFIGEWMGEASKMATEAVNKVSTSITDLIPPEVGAIASDIGSVVGEMGNIYMMIAKVIMDMPKIILGLLDGVTSALQALMDFPRALINALGRLDKIIARATDFLPGAIQGLAAALPSILKKIAAKLPDLIIAIADALPELAEALAEVLPDLVGKLVARIPDIVSSLTKSTGYAIWRMIVGLFRGIGDVWKGWKSPELKVGIDASYFSKSLANITQDTSKIFTVSALSQAYKGAQGMVNDITNAARGIGKNIWDYFVKAMLDGAKWLGDAGTKIWNGLKTAAAYIGEFGKAMWDGLVTAVGDIAKTFGEWGTKIWDGLVKAAEFIGDFGKAMWDGLVTAIGDVAKTFGDWGTKIWNGFKNTIGTAFEDFGGSISTGLTGALPAIGKAIESLFSGLGKVFQNLFKIDLTGIKTAISDAFTSGSVVVTNAFKAVFNPMIDVINGIIDALNGLKIPAITYGGSILGRDFGGTLIGETDLLPGDIGKVVKLATGGPVVGPGGTDMIPAMLTAGEFVMNRQSVSAIGLPVLNAMNQGKAGVGSSVQNITLHLTIESKERIDENFVRQRIMPTLRDELKRGSLDGRAVVYAGGVRK